MEKHFVAPENFEDARIIYRNFTGAGSRFNKEGERKFTYEFYDDDEAERLRNLGWYVKTKVGREEGDPVRYHIDVAVSFKSFPNVPPAAIYIYSNGVRTQLNEDTVSMLDSAEIRTVDLRKERVDRFLKEERAPRRRQVENRFYKYIEEIRALVRFLNRFDRLARRVDALLRPAAPLIGQLHIRVVEFRAALEKRGSFEPQKFERADRDVRVRRRARL